MISVALINSINTIHIFRRLMFIIKPLPFVETFIDELNNGIKQYSPNSELSNIQKGWLSFCIMSIIYTNTVCWAKFERIGLGKYTLSALSWMFRKSKIPWDILLQISVSIVLQQYGITKGRLGIDDTDKKRSKRTKYISKVHKMKDKGSGGYIMGQSLVFLILITDKITIPVGFSFYEPDPELKAWRKQDEKLKKQGVAKKDRPPELPRNPNYPTIPEISLNLLEQFKKKHSNIKIECILADALYGTAKFLDTASKIFGGIQVISQIKSNQNILFKGRERSVKSYFDKFKGVAHKIKIRGGKKVKVIVGSARLKVCSHGIKRFVIALKYEGEKEYRYIVASNLSWRTLDIVEAYTLRWLVEVFFEDWKQNEGWGNLTKHTGEDGSSRGLILSLLVDHCLFFHSDQKALIENKLPACTVGSLMGKIKVECFLNVIRHIVNDHDPTEKLARLTEAIEDTAYELMPSSKHMTNRKLGRFEPTPSLKYKAA